MVTLFCHSLCISVFLLISPWPTLLEFPQLMRVMEKPGDSALTDDDDSVLDIKEQYNRPSDIATQQQRVAAWHPILDPEWMIFSYLILAVILIPFGE